MNSITAVLEGPVSGMTRIYALLLSITFLFEELPEGTAANDYVSGSFASLLIVPLVCVRNIKKSLQFYPLKTFLLRGFSLTTLRYVQLLLAALLDTACLLSGTPDLPVQLIDEWYASTLRLCRTFLRRCMQAHAHAHVLSYTSPADTQTHTGWRRF